MTVLLAEHRLERVAGAVDVALGFQQGNVRLGTPAEVIARLELGPPVAHLGRMLGWDPVPLTVREARQRGGSLPAAARSASTSTSTPAAGSELVHIHNAWLRHGDAAAVRGIDLSLGEGEIVALLGRNGAGKTTLLRGIAGVHRPAKGSIQIRADGDDLHDPDPGVDTALCPQEPETLLFADTVGAELRATLRGHAKRTARRVVPDGAIGDTLAALGIDDLAGAHPRDLSAGQRLLVAVAAVAVSDTPVLLLDEPTRGLDPTVKGRLTAFLQDRGRRGGLVCVATHDFELAAAIATRVVVLAGGEIVADGDPGEVLGDSLVFAPQMTRAFGRGWLTPEQVAGALS
jgi:energy-coupling factor transport system ATP-binding protein